MGIAALLRYFLYPTGSKPDSRKYTVHKKMTANGRRDYRNGSIEQTDVDRVKVNEANQQSQLENLHTRMITQKCMLRASMGVYDDSPIHLSDTDVQSEFHPLLGRWTQVSPKRSDHCKLRKDLADLRVKLEWNKHLPTLSFMYQYNTIGSAKSSGSTAVISRIPNSL